MSIAESEAPLRPPLPQKVGGTKEKVGVVNENGGKDGGEEKLKRRLSGSFTTGTQWQQFHTTPV